MKKSRRKAGRKKITTSSIAGLTLCAALIGSGLYHALAYERPGGYFVVLLGACLGAIIFLIHRG